jgi:hypothetical protein
MMDLLTVGKRYRITLRSRTFGGYLEGLVRSTTLPRGALGNHDGDHRIWLIGELFEWFLRPAEIKTVEELSDRAPDEATVLPRAICEAPLHPAGIRGALNRHAPRSPRARLTRGGAPPKGLVEP